ncbi:MAG: hypothetical protein ACJ8FY_16785 [Gemmataceae bacterium]
MKIAFLTSVLLVLGLFSGCKSKKTDTAESSGPAKDGNVSLAGKAFLDQKKEIGPQLEWSREVVSKAGGTIAFRITSQGPFGVTVVTGAAWKAMQSRNEKAMNKADVLLSTNSKGPTYEGKVTIPAGSSFFILENQSNNKVEFHLECFPGD